MRLIAILPFLPALILATIFQPQLLALHQLLPRQTIATNNSTQCTSPNTSCGPFCIPSTYTCCPDMAGGCQLGTTCQLGDNDVYGCCPESESCGGDGGTQFLNGEAGSDGNGTESGGSATSSAGPPEASTFVGNGAGRVEGGGWMTIGLLGLVAMILL
jgi:hypothetical protein